MLPLMLAALTFGQVHADPLKEFWQAMADSRKTECPVLVVFVSDPCPHCEKLKKGPLSDAEVVRDLEQFHVVYLDVKEARKEPRIKAFMDDHKIHRFPTLLVAEGDGTKLAMREGYVDPLSLRVWLFDVIKIRKKPQGIVF